MEHNTRVYSITRIINVAAVFLFILVILNSTAPVSVNASTGNTYTVKASSKPYKSQFVKYTTYNEKTRQYYMLRSYLELFEKKKGGTLILSKGTYVITNTLSVPSNVTIILKDGVILKKGTVTDTKKMPASKSMFQLVEPSKQGKSNAIGQYNGASGITIKGEGTVILDLNFVQDSIGIVIGHNTNIAVSGITFMNMYSGHFIEMDASKHINIENNNFKHHKASISGIKEAINIDTPDTTTEGFNVIWSNHDCTPNIDVVIKNNNFEDLERAIGTHKYSEGKFHESIQIIDNKIYKTDSDAIRVLNWNAPIITGNTIEMVAEGKGTFRAILASGLIGAIIKSNTFSDMGRPIQIMPWKNPGAGSQYAITYNDISSDDIDVMLQNNLIRVQEHFIRVNRTYDVYGSDTDKYYYSEEFIKD